MAHTAGVKRGCGLRAAGGIYFETGLSQHGRPVEDFLIDPPIAVDLKALGISDVGVHLVEHRGRKVVMDVVGVEHYPNVADFIEEVRRFGVSRRAPVSFPFDELDARTVLLMIHRKAVIKNAADYYTRDASIDWTCPKRVDGHRSELVWREYTAYYDGDDVEPLTETCAGLWWRDLPPMDATDTKPAKAMRDMPSFRYEAWRRPATIVPEYEYGIFAAFPITNVSIIHTEDRKRLTKAVDAVAQSPLPYSIDLE